MLPEPSLLLLNPRAAGSLVGPLRLGPVGPARLVRPRVLWVGLVPRRSRVPWSNHSLLRPSPSALSSLPIAGPDAGAKAAAEAAGEELEEKHEARTSMDPTGYGGNPGYGGPEGNFGVLPISSPSTSSSTSHPLPSMPRLSLLSGDFGTPMLKDDVSELSETEKSARSKSSKSSSISVSRSVFAAMQAQLQASSKALLANARAVQVREDNRVYFLRY